MKIASSLAVKVGGGAVAGLAGTASIYYAAQHFSKDKLHAIEREVVEKDIKLTVSEQTTPNKIITVQAQLGEKSWSCKISVEGEATNEKVKELANKIRDNLPTTDARVEYWDKPKSVLTKSLLVVACSNDKTATDSSVEGKLILEKKESPEAFSFKRYPLLNTILDSGLQEVEREVIEKDVKLEFNSDKSKVTLTAAENGEAKLTTNYTWSCEINLSPEQDSEHTTLKDKLKENLFKDNENTNKQRWNKELLVRACHSEPTTKNNQVKGTLTLKKTSNPTKYEFPNHSELSPLLKGVS